MTAREQLSDVIVRVLDHDRRWPDAQETAIAIADAVLGRIKPLVWQRNGNHYAGGHGFVIRKIGSTYFLTIRNMHGQGYDTIEAAKAAAEAHHRAQILAALGIAEEIEA